MKTEKPKLRTNSREALKLSDAEICRANGWRRGTNLFGKDDPEETLLRVTAVGDENILAVEWGLRGWEPEMTWTLTERDWRRVIG